MVVFNEEEEESKSRYEGNDYSQPSSGAYQAVQITDHSLGPYMKQYGATTKVVSHSPGLGGGLIGAGGQHNIGLIHNTDNTDDGAIMNMDGNEGEDGAAIDDEDDFFNQDDRDMTDYNYQR